MLSCLRDKTKCGNGSGKVLFAAARDSIKHRIAKKEKIQRRMDYFLTTKKMKKEAKEEEEDMTGLTLRSLVET